MIREWLMPAKILTGVCVLAASAFSQTYTISAKPGAVNFIEGDVSVNDDPVWKSNLKSTFLNANDVLAVKDGKAEVLLTPGVFLRLGHNSQVRMVKPSLIETQIEILSGESMVEVDDLVPGSGLVVLDHGSSTTLLKAGLYRFNEGSVATLEGKADVAFGDHHLEVKKDRQVVIENTLHATKVDLNQSDDLYAWSNSRAQYDAAATYAGAKDVYNNSSSGYSSSFNSPGWYWNSPFNSFMWLPGNGAFYSPFGWGFYGPGVVAYAPVVAYPYYGRYGFGGGYPVASSATAATKPVAYVPVNPKNVGVSNFQGNSPAAFAAARSQMQATASYYGLRTASGGPAAILPHGQMFSSFQAASRAAASNAHSNSAASGGGYSGSGYSASGVSTSSSTAHSSGSTGGGAMAGGHSSGGHGK